MLEVADRAGLARTVNWTVGGAKALLPNILFHSSPLFPAPAYAEMSIARSEDGLRAAVGDETAFVLRESINPPLSYRREPSTEEAEGALIVRGDAGDLRARPEEVFIMGNAFELRRDARAFAAAVASLRNDIGYNRLIYAPGIMEPSNLALLVYMGVDLMDSSLLVYQGSRGRLLLPEGVLNASDAKWLSSPQDAVQHNLDAAWRELQLVRHMIRAGRLRELAETRAHSTPWGVAALRLFDREHFEHQERYAPVVGPAFYANTKMAMFRPDVWRFRRRIMERWAPAPHKKVLLLLPCSAKKPYYTSKSHRLFEEVLLSVPNSCAVQELIITSPLGAVPRELELFYPAAQYDIPVTGHWDGEERAMVRELVAHAAGFGFVSIINHLGTEGDLVSGVVDAICTADESSTSRESLDRLREALLQACGEVEKAPRAQDRVEMLRSAARYQFGPEGGVLLDDATVVGKYPYLKVMDGKEQLAMLTPDRGMLSLTMDGAKRLLGHGLGWVEMGDFDLTGSLFAVGVKDADVALRPGDEAVILRNGEVEGVGVAVMSGTEMADGRRGEAVKVRHKRRRK
jgi:archaeosine synthase